MTARFTPPGYVSVTEVRQRAYDRWGGEHLAKLRGYLRAGELTASWPDRTDSISPEFWETSEGERLLNVRLDVLNRWPVPPPVFRESDLDRAIPHPLTEAVARSKAAREARKAIAIAIAENAVTPRELAAKGNRRTKQVLPHRRPRGATPSKSPHIEAEMRKMDRNELQKMIGKQMKERFKAAISTCTACRDRVLSKNSD